MRGDEEMSENGLEGMENESERQGGERRGGVERHGEGLVQGRGGRGWAQGEDTKGTSVEGNLNVDEYLNLLFMIYSWDGGKSQIYL